MYETKNETTLQFVLLFIHYIHSTLENNTQTTLLSLPMLDHSSISSSLWLSLLEESELDPVVPDSPDSPDSDEGIRSSRWLLTESTAAAAAGLGSFRFFGGVGSEEAAVAAGGAGGSDGA